jgi:16S rRNA (guanine527-N7)-methyltransferase
LQVTLLDSLGKRVNWLKEISPALGRPDVNCIHGRAEEYGVDLNYREQFDVATSRAVADLRMLCELCLPFVKVGGYFLSMKSVDSDQELKSADHGIRLLGGKVEELVDYTIPGTDVTHRVVVIRKEKNTPKGFPRRFAKIQKSPL